MIGWFLPPYYLNASISFAVWSSCVAELTYTFSSIKCLSYAYFDDSWKRSFPWRINQGGPTAYFVFIAVRRTVRMVWAHIPEPIITLLILITRVLRYLLIMYTILPTARCRATGDDAVGINCRGVEIEMAAWLKNTNGNTILPNYQCSLRNKCNYWIIRCFIRFPNNLDIWIQ